MITTTHSSFERYRRLINSKNDNHLYKTEESMSGQGIYRIKLPQALFPNKFLYMTKSRMDHIILRHWREHDAHFSCFADAVNYEFEPEDDDEDDLMQDIEMETNTFQAHRLVNRFMSNISTETKKEMQVVYQLLLDYLQRSINNLSNFIGIHSDTSKNRLAFVFGAQHANFQTEGHFLYVPLDPTSLYIKTAFFKKKTQLQEKQDDYLNILTMIEELNIDSMIPLLKNLPFNKNQLTVLRQDNRYNRNYNNNRNRPWKNN